MFAAVLSARLFTVDELVAIAQTDRDTRLRAQAAEWVARESLWNTRTRPLRILARCKYPEVRAVAVTGLVRAGHADEAAGFLTDSSPLIRATARAAYRGKPVDHYREAAATSLGAIDGLAETGSAMDAPLLLPLLTHPTPKIRAHVLRALRHLDAVPSVYVLIPMLHDSSPAVVRAATNALRGAALAEAVLWNLLTAVRPATRRAGYRLLRERGPDSRIEAARRLLGDSDPRLSRQAAADLA